MSTCAPLVNRRYLSVICCCLFLLLTVQQNQAQFVNPGLFPDSRSLNDMPEPYAALLAETDQPVERRTDINSFSFQGRAITLSPMPVQGLMYMETSTNIEVVDFVNAAGEVIWHRDTDGRTFHFDISEIPAGVYSLKLNDEPVRGIVFVE